MNELVTTSPEVLNDAAPVVEELRAGLKYEAGALTLARLPTTVEREILERRARKLHDGLRPISYSDAKKQHAGAAIAEMMQGFPNFKPGESGKETSIGYYVMQLMEFPLFAVERACKDISGGRVNGLNPDFPPSVARVAQLARAHAEPFIAEQHTIKSILATKRIGIDQNVNPEQAAYVADGLRDLAESIRAKIDAEEEKKRVERARKTLEQTRKTILEEYRAKGIEPVYVSGQPVSLSLVNSLRRQAGRLPSGGNYQDEGT